jgi:hypothetical protein
VVDGTACLDVVHRSSKAYLGPLGKSELVLEDGRVPGLSVVVVVVKVKAVIALGLCRFGPDMARIDT